MKGRHALGKKTLNMHFFPIFLSLVFAEEHSKGKITDFLFILQRILYEISQKVLLVIPIVQLKILDMFGKEKTCFLPTFFFPLTCTYLLLYMWLND